MNILEAYKCHKIYRYKVNHRQQKRSKRTSKRSCMAFAISAQKQKYGKAAAK